MTEPERTPRTTRQFERTLEDDEELTFLNVEVVSIRVKRKANHAGRVRIVATVIDKPSPACYE